MPVMTRMRAMSKYFIIIIGGLFILFMIIGDTKIMDIFGRHQNIVGSINGKDISIQEFSKRLEEYRRQYREQNKVDIDDDNLDQLRDQLWDEFIYKTLTQQQIDKFNIVVTDKEVNDQLFGPNPPDFLKRQFIDSAGTFRRDIYDQALKDPRNKEILVTVKDALKEQLFAEKLQAVINGASLPTAGEIKRRFIDQNLKMTADYAFVDINLFPENTINVTNDDIKKYYEDHPEKFSVDAQRKLAYVVFPVQASKADSESTRQTLQNLAELAANDTLSLDSLSKTYAGLQVVKDSSDISAFPVEVTKNVLDAKKGQIVGPLATQTGYALYQFSKTEELKEPAIRASHILITGTDTASAIEAERIFKELKGGANFEELANIQKIRARRQKAVNLAGFQKAKWSLNLKKQPLQEKLGKS
jgi:peptidyl-prolyl cis-trans isomerase D